MKAVFTFKLEPVLNYRKNVEEKKVAEFLDKRQKLDREKEVLVAIQEEKTFILEQFKKIQKSRFSSTDVFLYLSYVKILNEKEAAQSRIVEQVSKELENMRQELLASIKDRKIMDNLKERQFLEFKEDDELRERRAANEMAIQGFVRNEK